jgi:uncharacterized protein involved in oxidation of intracellular sulfur
MRKKILVIVKGPPYGADETCNAVRLANALARRDDAEVVVFLVGEAVTCAIAGQRTPDGYCALDRMLRSFARHDGRIACCGTCLDARGLTKEQLVAEAARSRLDELADWTVAADRVLTF